MQGKEKIDKNALFLLDGSYFLYRSYFALPTLQNAQGHPTQTTYAFCRTINKLIKDFSPHYMAVVWDTKGGSKQNKELHEEYKATRPEPPSDLFIQKDDIVNFLDIVKISNIVEPGYEADDLIGSMAQDNKDSQVVIVCPDKDMYQLLTLENVIIIDPFKSHIVDAQLYEEEKGFSPEKVTFYYSLLGDKSDNIPGVAGVGEKSALELVKQFDSLDDLYANLDKVEKNRTKNALEKNKDNAYLSLKLFTLDYHKVPETKEECLFDKNNWANARSFFEQLELRALIRELDGAGLPTQQSLAPQVNSSDKNPPVDHSWHCETVCTRKQLDTMIKEIEQAGYCGMDTETSGVEPLIDKFVGLSFACNTTTSYYIPVDHPENPNYPQLPKEEVLDALRPLLTSEKIKKILHNTKFDELVLWNQGIDLHGVDFDTLLAANTVRQAWQKINLKDLSMRHLGEPMEKFKDIMGKTYKSFDQVPIEKATRYAAHDALQTLKLKAVFEKTVKKEKKLYDFYSKIEMPLYHVLTKMEKRGVLVNPDVLSNVAEEVEQAIQNAEAKIFSALPQRAKMFEGEQLNLGSPKQIESLLFDHLGLSPIKKTKKGVRSTDHEVLKVLSKIHPIPSLLIQHRELSKLLSTYLKPLPASINPKTKRIHTSYSQTMVVTGRLSSNNPNLQNIPASQSYGHQIRSAFIADQGNVLISADYSQIELRVLAHLSQDDNLVDAFLHDRDIHQQTAAQLFSVAPEAVTHEQRQIGKRINFSIIYGQTPFGLSKELEIPQGEAKEYIEKYFEQYPGVEAWMEKTVEFAQKTGYVESEWGKRRYIPELHERNKSRQNAGRRFAINTPVQGTSADIMKIAMININKALEAKKLQAEIIMQIHDEIIIESDKKQADKVSQLIKDEMETITNWQVPLKVSLRTGVNWGEITK